MADLALYQYVLIGLIFVWSGFVRSGLGFGGAALSLPFLLSVHNQPLIFLPIIAGQLLFFGSLTIWQNNRRRGNTTSPQTSTVDWRSLRWALAIMIVPKLIGVFGLLTLPTNTMSGIIFVIIGIYSIGYIVDRPFTSKHLWLDIVFLIIGAYISGTSLIGAPLIIAAMMNHVNKAQLRDTLFALWIILVLIKMAAFIYAGVDLQLTQHLWLLPLAGIGHVLGLKVHGYLVKSDSQIFYRVLGSVLLLISAIGAWQAFH